jgi:hypothetical protein
VFLHLAADALEWCGASRAEPLPLEGLRERFLPEALFRGRQNAKLLYAVLAAAGIHGGTEPDLLDEVAFWQTGRHRGGEASCGVPDGFAGWHPPALPDCAPPDHGSCEDDARAAPRYACPGL